MFHVSHYQFVFAKWNENCCESFEKYQKCNNRYLSTLISATHYMVFGLKAKKLKRDIIIKWDFIYLMLKSCVGYNELLRKKVWCSYYLIMIGIGYLVLQFFWKFFMFQLRSFLACIILFIISFYHICFLCLRYFT